MIRTLALASALLLAAGAARAQDEGESGEQAVPGVIPFNGFLLFYDVQGPLSFDAMTPKDLPADAVRTGEVEADSCQHELSVPLSATLRATSVSGAGGNGGYAKALASLRRAHPELKGVFDVKIDIHTIIVLGIYHRVCTEITARGFK